MVFLVIFSVVGFFATPAFAQYYSYEFEIDGSKVCREDYNLIIKTDSTKQVCVSILTAERLADRQWGFNQFVINLDKKEQALKSEMPNKLEFKYSSVQNNAVFATIPLTENLTDPENVMTKIDAVLGGNFMEYKPYCILFYERMYQSPPDIKCFHSERDVMNYKSRLDLAMLNFTNAKLPHPTHGDLKMIHPKLIKFAYERPNNLSQYWAENKDIKDKVPSTLQGIVRDEPYCIFYDDGTFARKCFPTMEDIIPFNNYIQSVHGKPGYYHIYSNGTAMRDSEGCVTGYKIGAGCKKENPVKDAQATMPFNWPSELVTQHKKIAEPYCIIYDSTLRSCFQTFELVRMSYDINHGMGHFIYSNGTAITDKNGCILHTSPDEACWHGNRVDTLKLSENFNWP